MPKCALPLVVASLDLAGILARYALITLPELTAQLRRPSGKLLIQALEALHILGEAGVQLVRHTDAQRLEFQGGLAVQQAPGRDAGHFFAGTFAREGSFLELDAEMVYHVKKG